MVSGAGEADTSGKPGAALALSRTAAMDKEPPRRCLAALRCLQQLAQRFEQAWKDGAHPRLDAFLPDDAALRPAVLLELVEADLILRLEKGESARVEHYLERFPD